MEILLLVCSLMFIWIGYIAGAKVHKDAIEERWKEYQRWNERIAIMQNYYYALKHDADTVYDEKPERPAFKMSADMIGKWNNTND